MFLELALLGGLLALDQTSLGQFMVSRPLVGGTVAGWLLGDPLVGLAVGGTLEVLFLPAFPVGGARYPETGPSSVVGAAGAVWTGGGAGMALGVGLGIAWALVGESTIRGLRRRNERLAPDADAEPLSPRLVVRRHLGALALDGIRGLAVTAAGLALARWVFPILSSGWLPGEGVTLATFGAAGGFALGGLVACYSVRRWRTLALVAGFAAGGAAGALL